MTKMKLMEPSSKENLTEIKIKNFQDYKCSLNRLSKISKHLIDYINTDYYMHYIQKMLLFCLYGRN